MHASTFAILRRLAHGGALPAAAVAARPALQRAAAELAAHEVDLRFEGDAVRLAAPFDALDAGALRAALAADGAAVDVEVLDACGSTNAELAARMEAGAPGGTAVACELQTAGHGRRGARWAAPFGGAIACSLGWRFARGIDALGALSLAAGVACARALERIGAAGVQLKWPNDLLLGTGKLGGILVEARGVADAGASVVVGVGINVRLSAAARANVDRPVADLADAGSRAPRNAVLAALLGELARALPVFERDGFAAFRDAWMARHAWQGQQVAVAAPPRPEVLGIARGVDATGAFLLHVGGRLERIHFGEVRVRSAGAARA